MTIGDWELARRMARLNVENFKKIQFERSLDGDEREMGSRASETLLLLDHLVPPP